MANSEEPCEVLVSSQACAIVILAFIFDFIVGINSLILISNTERTSENVNDLLVDIATKDITESVVAFSAVCCLVGVAVCYCKDDYDNHE